MSSRIAKLLTLLAFFYYFHPEREEANNIYTIVPEKYNKILQRFESEIFDEFIDELIRTRNPKLAFEILLDKIGRKQWQLVNKLYNVLKKHKILGRWLTKSEIYNFAKILS